MRERNGFCFLSQLKRWRWWRVTSSRGEKGRGRKMNIEWIERTFTSDETTWTGKKMDKKREEEWLTFCLHALFSSSLLFYHSAKSSSSWWEKEERGDRWCSQSSTSSSKKCERRSWCSCCWCFLPEDSKDMEYEKNITWFQTVTYDSRMNIRGERG